MLKSSVAVSSRNPQYGKRHRPSASRPATANAPSSSKFVSVLPGEMRAPYAGKPADIRATKRRATSYSRVTSRKSSMYRSKRCGQLVRRSLS